MKDQAAAYSELPHRSLDQVLFPAILRQIDRIRPAPEALLDFGCGDGRLLSRVSTPRIAALDASQTMLQETRRRLGTRLGETYRSHRELPSQAFDVVTSSLVLMMIGSRDEYEATVRSIYRTLRPGGAFILALTHPCFRSFAFSELVTEFAHGEPFDYFREGRPFVVTLRDPQGERSVELTDHHWSLSFSINALCRAGFSIEAVEEPPDAEAPPDAGPHEGHRVPPYLLISSRRPPDAER